jgi:hypothetical protein
MPVLSSLSGHEANDIALAAVGPRRWLNSLHQQRLCQTAEDRLRKQDRVASKEISIRSNSRRSAIASHIPTSTSFIVVALPE